ncbi:MAG TPA: phosphoglucosamine mutase [Fimbriimonadaceae bacterium]|nr:phosphoglucosamine mutase [Fimbriimonadaceae bacterium]
MSRKHFGTDGVRGVANSVLTPELTFSLGQAAGKWLGASGEIPRAVIGRDTRRSGSMLGAALASGLCSMGVDVVTLGVAPTPTVAFAARVGEFGLGAIISASHNPAPDNGIKFVGHDGRKLHDEVEEEIERLMEAESLERPTGEGLGTIESLAARSGGAPRDFIVEYEEFLVSLVPERLEGMKVALDAAHGAAYAIAPAVLKRLGATVFLTGTSPNGMNINAEGGATKPERVQAFTKSTGADVGVAFDGDADRAVFSDEEGHLINGDRTIAIWSAHWKAELEPRVVVGTVMSNGGFEQYLRQREIELLRTPVGDKHVARRLAETGAKIGGEQSGHIIFPERGPTGDGLVTMLEVLRVLKREGRAASSFYREFENWPQLLVNIGVQSRDGWDQGPLVSRALQLAEAKLLGRGRLVARASGTQPMVRIMVEADEAGLRDEVAATIVGAMKEEVGGQVTGQVDLTHALGD